MAAKNSQNKQGLSKNEAIIQGLQACYKVGVPIIKAVLDANNGHFEKSMKVLEFLSKDQKNVVKNKKPNPDKKKFDKNFKKKSKDPTLAGVKNEENKNIKMNVGANSNNQKGVNKKKIPAVKTTKPATPDDSWVVVDMKKTGAVPKNKSKNIKSKESIIKSKESMTPPGINIPVNAPSVIRGKSKESIIKCKESMTPPGINIPANAPSIIRGDLMNENKKKRRAFLKSNFEIIRQKSDPVNRIRDYIKFEIKVLILMRGCPGSGKSTFAQELLRTNGIMNVNDHIFSTDNYFSRNGSYVFNPDMLPEAHKWNKSLVETIMRTGFSPVIVDNTNIKAWEMEPYVQCAVRLGYVIETVEPRTPWFFNESILAKKNIHGVSKWKIEQMLSLYEANLTGETLLNTFKLSYKPANSPPQLVSNNNITNIKNTFTKTVCQVVSSKNSVKIPAPKITKNFSESDLLFPAKPPFSFDTDLKYTNRVPGAGKVDRNKQIDENSSLLDRPMDENIGGPLLKPSFFSSEPHLSETIPDEADASSSKWTTDLLKSLPDQNQSLLLSGNVSKQQSDEKLEKDENVQQLIELFPEMDVAYLKNIYLICQRDMDLTISTLFNPTNPFQMDVNVEKCQDDEANSDSSDSDEESASDEEDENSDDTEIEEDSSDENIHEDVKMLMKHFPDMNINEIKEAFVRSDRNYNVAFFYLKIKSKIGGENEDKVTGSTSIQGTILPSASENNSSPSVSQPQFLFLDEGKRLSSSLEKDNEDIPIGDNLDQFVLESKSSEPNVEDKSSLFAFQKVSDEYHEKKLSEGNDSSKVSSLEESSPLSTPSKEKSCGKYGDFISLENLKQAMSNVFGSLNEVSTASSLEGLEGTTAMVTSENTASSLSKEKSELISNLLSWNRVPTDSSSLVGQLNKNPKQQREIFKMGDTQEKLGYVSSSTNTNYKDFELLKNSNPSNILGKILVGSPNFQSCNNNSIIERRVLMLDKGTFTEEVELNYFCPSNSSLLILEGMFPTVPKDDLSELLTSCGGDVNWVVGLLLDSGLEISSEFNNSKVPIEACEPPDLQNSEEKTILELTSKCESQVASLKSKKKKSHSGSSLLALENLKLNFVMNDNSDSSNLRKVRNLRHNITEEAPNLDGDSSTSPEVVENSTTEMEEEDLSIPIGTDLVKELQAQFGGLLHNKLEDGKVMVNLPVQLARQLHSYIMDSLDQQFEEEEKILQNMISEDESLAQVLHEVENGIQVKQPSLQEIMDNELALNLHKLLNRDTDRGNTIASKLSEQLLIERFPRMDPSTLKAILEDTDHSLYQATHLLEAAGYTPSTLESSDSLVHDGALISREEAVEQANAYREAAKVFIDLRKECLAKAEKAFSDGMKSVASYYSQMARWHDERIEQANLLASTILLDGNKDATTLDLHFLRVREASMVLDLFLDAHIRNLIEMKARKRDVFIITGRGIHSTNGKSKIKPVVLNRLRQRNIVFRAVNPGLFMVTIYAKSALTCHK